MQPYTITDIKKIPKPQLAEMFLRLLEQTYTSEMIDTEMAKIDIGENGTYADKRDWQESRISDLTCNRK